MGVNCGPPSPPRKEVPKCEYCGTSPGTTNLHCENCGASIPKQDRIPPAKPQVAPVRLVKDGGNFPLTRNKGHKVKE